MKKSLIEQFFEADSDIQKFIIATYTKRKRILSEKEHIECAQNEVNTRLEDLQKECDHPLLVTKTNWNEDEYGKTLRGGYHAHKCPDCGKHWHESFDE